MDDISTCNGEGCPKKAQCLRYTCVNINGQSYFATAPYSPQSGVCAYFLDNDKKGELLGADK